MPVLVGNNIPEMSLNVSLDLVNFLERSTGNKEKGPLQEHLKQHQQIPFCLSVQDRSDKFEKETLLLCGNSSSFVAGFSMYCFGVCV